MTSKFTGRHALMAAMFFVAFLLYGCSDYWHPVQSTPAPTEYQFNYWLLEKTYLFEEELKGVEPEGDSVSDLYNSLEDPFTRYVPPAKSESANISLNTSIVQGDIGLEYAWITTASYPLTVYRVYPESPASAAGVPRYSQIFSINGVSLYKDDFSSLNDLYGTFRSVLDSNKEITLVVITNEASPDTLSFTMEKRNVYAPTVFIDTLYETIVITITEFKQTTINQTEGTFGELKAYLDSTKSQTEPRIIDVRNNPGGHVSQCVSMADLFISSGNISTRFWRAFDGSGVSRKRKNSVVAKAGDPGEGLPFVLYQNSHSASCAEIFTAAISEGADIPVVGETSYGKGIGQTTWQTPANGIAIITNLEFLTPKGNSYHKKGVEPNYLCKESNSISCAVEAIGKHYGKTASLKKKSLNERAIIPIPRNTESLAGAYLEGEQN